MTNSCAGNLRAFLKALLPLGAPRAHAQVRTRAPEFAALQNGNEIK
jgi:hypothetical protein